MPGWAVFGNSLALSGYILGTLDWFPERPLPPVSGTGPEPYTEYNTSTIQSRKFSAGGTDCDFAISQLETYGPSYYRPETLLNVASLTTGSNDYVHGSTVAACFANILDFVATAQAMGYLVIVNTVPSAQRFDTTAGNTWRDDLNTEIRNGAATYNYLVADVASDPDIGCRTCYLNPTYFVDDIHFTAAGNLILGSYTYALLSALGFS